MSYSYLHEINHKFFLGILLNVIFIIVEVIYGVQANSIALIADAMHNASDVVGLVISWAGFRLSFARSPAKFTYGFKNATIIAAFINALLLFTAVGILSCEAIARFQQEEVVAPKTIVIVASIAILVHGLTAWLFREHRHKDLNIQGMFLHMILDTATSLGVVIGGLLALWQSWTWVDPALTLLIAVIILGGSWKLFRESLNLMLQAVPASIDFKKITMDVKKLPGVVEYHDLHIWPISTTETALTVHLVIEEPFFKYHSTQFYTQEIQRLHKISHITIQLEINQPPRFCKMYS